MSRSESTGKVLVTPGWLTVYGKEAQDEDSDANLTPVKPNENVQTSAVEVKQLQTKPPPRYTEATLLSAMEGAGKLVEDDELREAMREKGLGTPATRASIIEGLIYEQYIVRNARELQATCRALFLYYGHCSTGLGVPGVEPKPELTGDWSQNSSCTPDSQRRQKSPR